MNGTARLSAVVAWLTIIGWTSICSVSEASETPPLPAPGQTDPLEEARKNPEAVETLLLHARGLKEIPEEVFRLPNLRELSLGENQLTEVPGDIGKLKNLAVLGLDDNQIRSLPEEIGYLTKLTSLALHHNPLESLPDSLSRLHTLRDLTLFDTRLGGKIPAGLLQLLKAGSPELLVICDWEAFDDIAEYRLDSSRRVEASYDKLGRPYLALGVEPSAAAANANVFLYRHEERGVMLFDPELEESATELDCHPDSPALRALPSEERIRTLEARCKPELFSVFPRGTVRLAVSRVTAETVEVCGSAVISVGAQVEPPPSDVLLVVSSDAPPAPVVVPPESLRLKEWPASIREEDFGFPKGVLLKQVTFFEHPGGSENEFLAEVVARGLHFIVGQEDNDYHYQWKEATWMFFIGDEGVKLLSPSAGDWPYVPDSSFRAAVDLDGNGELDLILGTTDMVVLFRHRGGYLRKGFPVRVVNLEGNLVTSSDEEYTELSGVAWRDDGDVWYSAQEPGREQAVYALSLSGGSREVLRSPGSLSLHDISRDGRLVISQDKARFETMGLAPGDSKEKDLTWLDRTFVEDITPDGRTIVFHEGGIGGAMISGRSHGAAFLRGTDGSPAVRLGVGQPLALSPDGKWVTLVTDDSKTRMALYPTGAGDSRELPAGTVRQYYDAWWFPDGRRLLIAGNEENRPRRLFIQDLSGGDPKPFTPENVWTVENAISPDGKWVAASDPGKGVPMSLYPVEEGEVRAIPGLSPEDYVLRWSPDARHLFVTEGDRGVALSIFRLDLETGLREPWKDLTPADPAGVPGILWICLTPDGRSYAYTHRRILSDLYLVEE